MNSTIYTISVLIVVYLFSGVATSFENDATADHWNKLAQKKLLEALQRKPNTNVAKNVIVFLGDGMGIATITASRIRKGQLANKRGEEESLSFEAFPDIALIKTYNVDKQVPDSAGTATAVFSGVKTNYEMLGVTAETKNLDCESSFGNEVSSILQWAQEEGKHTGIVTTTRLTHATPASLYSHSASRYWESDVSKAANASKCKDIARQLIENKPGRNVKVILGGGLKNFVTANPTGSDIASGQRKDGMNLVADWLEQKQKLQASAKFVKNSRELREVNRKNTDYLLGIFAQDHMSYEPERDRTDDGQPSLTEMTENAIKFLQKSPKGYFLMVEGGRIDHAHHANLARKALEETVSFDKAIEATLKLVDTQDTLIVVTADHSHTMTINGYPIRGSNILGFAGASNMDNVTYTTLSYATGLSAVPDVMAARVKLNETDTMDYNYKQLALFPYDDETHGGEDVAVYAIGPMSHLFQGVQEQSYIAHVLGYASCIGANKDHCNLAARIPYSFVSVVLITCINLFIKRIF